MKWSRLAIQTIDHKTKIGYFLYSGIRVIIIGIVVSCSRCGSKSLLFAPGYLQDKDDQLGIAVAL